MKCPKCGAQLPQNIYTCSKCGYQLKTSEKPDPFAYEETQEVRPSQARFKKSKPNNNGGGFFNGGFGNVFSGLFGDFFEDDDSSSGYDDDPKNYDDFGNEVDVPDEFERDSIEIKDIEVIEDDDNNDDKKRKR